MVSKGSYGWWQGKGYKVLSKRRKKLVDGKTHRVVELSLIYDPLKDNKDMLRWNYKPFETLWVPVGNFAKYFKIDNTIGLLYEKPEET